jgi:hypothetical protein
MIWDEVPTMVEIAIFSISLMPQPPCTGNDTPETMQQCGIFCLSLLYVWTVPTVWYFLFISIICLNCSHSVVFFVYFYHMLELLQQCGIFCIFLSYVGTVPTLWYFLFISIICWNCYNSVVFFVFISSICCYKTLIQ